MNKKEFIMLLETTLVNANLDVTSLTLLDNDTVQIMFKGNGKRNVNITADSHKAIILDVLQFCD